MEQVIGAILLVLEITIMGLLGLAGTLLVMSIIPEYMPKPIATEQVTISEN